MSGSLCDDPHNMYAPCESDNGGVIVAFYEGDPATNEDDQWNSCELGEFTISGQVTPDGICHCMGTVADGDGGADTYNGGVGTESFTKELWNSGCSDNASECIGDLDWCMGYDDFCNAV